jgi:hypothetical protein
MAIQQLLDRCYGTNDKAGLSMVVILFALLMTPIGCAENNIPHEARDGWAKLKAGAKRCSGRLEYSSVIAGGLSEKLIASRSLRFFRDNGKFQLDLGTEGKKSWVDNGVEVFTIDRNAQAGVFQLTSHATSAESKSGVSGEYEKYVDSYLSAPWTIGGLGATRCDLLDFTGHASFVVLKQRDRTIDGIACIEYEYRRPGVVKPEAVWTGRISLVPSCCWAAKEMTWAAAGTSYTGGLSISYMPSTDGAVAMSKAVWRHPYDKGGEVVSSVQISDWRETAANAKFRLSDFGLRELGGKPPRALPTVAIFTVLLIGVAVAVYWRSLRSRKQFG